MFLPTFNEETHLCAAIKSQIAQVMMSYIAITNDPLSLIPLEPPPIDPINPQKPDIEIFKLMLSSNNSTEGIGEILKDIINQSNLTDDKFFSELRAMEGASHTLWNIGQAIYLKHFGDNKIPDNLGAWKTLHALGLPWEKPVAKNDFTLMLTNIQKIHEVTLIHCLLLVMGIPQTSLPNEKLKLKAKSINHVINLCYDRFFGCAALKRADGLNSPKLFGLITPLRDFATIVEANRSMKQAILGDY
ncbi:hypothetical protein PGTUg99_037266 [Puccinia graminis f. sp. tritici]|uniref:DUF6589 domain-containing protein n=1 Tax=Puccinia graminis f. sp. tritici TaxID=56615 RepID=A0A5B0SFS0_PUCGR|nr:hypothetical protein PGTUg99_037266 [Puccinia graminis f. sp. tritici]